MSYRVQMVFSDCSLGGTSRSALQLGRAWASCGAEIDFRPQLPIHPSRVEAFRDIGIVYADPDRAPSVAEADLVHFHHGGWSRGQIAVARRLVSEAREAEKAPELLTHNVFAVADRLLDRWPRPRAVGVLASWGAAQYRVAMGCGLSRAHLAVIPNAQDAVLFRAPDRRERAESRERHGIDAGRPVVLRVGSPIEQKWSRDYVRLVTEHPEMYFVFVGVPASLEARLRREPNVLLQGLVSSDEELRSYYWCADLFLHLADRGESFGNVILESLLCGTPVVCLARPLRDNGPWEFRDIPGFMYARSLREVGHVLTLLKDGRLPMTSLTGVGASIHERYSGLAVAGLLRRVMAGETAVNDPLPVGIANLAKVSLFHNPLVSAMKSLRQELGGPRVCPGKE